MLHAIHNEPKTSSSSLHVGLHLNSTLRIHWLESSNWIRFGKALTDTGTMLNVSYMSYAQTFILKPSFLSALLKSYIEKYRELRQAWIESWAVIQYTHGDLGTVELSIKTREIMRIQGHKFIYLSEGNTLVRSKVCYAEKRLCKYT